MGDLLILFLSKERERDRAKCQGPCPRVDVKEERKKKPGSDLLGPLARPCSPEKEVLYGSFLEGKKREEH